METGGILGSNGETISFFEFDIGLECTDTEYHPDISKINNILNKWNEQKIQFVGLIHSHINSNKLSYSDVEYARKIISLNKICGIYMFLYIITTGEFVAFYVNNEKVELEKFILL